MGGWDPTAKTVGPGTHVLATWLFLRLLGFIYLTAFVSVATQIRGLCGRQGILPAAEFLVGRQHWGLARFWRWPSLFWLNTSDHALLFVSWGGAALALLLVLGVAPIPVLLLLWFFYLSLFTACRLFLCYQWDILLLEAGFLALFLAPPEILPEFPPRRAPPAMSVWLMWWLLFRLLFWSGAVKVRSRDLNWRKLTALKYHYQTQPLPTPLAWYAHRLPGFIEKLSVALVLGIELIAPFLIPAPPPWRYAAAALFILLMVAIELTGNYAFFNLLGIALSVMLLDDRALLLLGGAHLHAAGLPIHPASNLADVLSVAVALLVLLLSLDSAATLFRLGVSWPHPIVKLFDWLEPWRLVNSYGLFAVMTTARPELVVEGSEDGRTWEEYEFRWKPGDVRRSPGFVAPHQPRLDWQMWFAALGTPLSNLWLERFRTRLLQSSPHVLRLLGRNPFPENPPRYLRVVLYEYRFTDAAERRATGAWWHRERRGVLEP